MVVAGVVDFVAILVIVVLLASLPAVFLVVLLVAGLAFHCRVSLHPLPSVVIVGHLGPASYRFLVAGVLILRSDALNDRRLCPLRRVVVILGVALVLVLLDHAEEAIDLVADAVNIAHLDVQTLPLRILPLLLRVADLALQAVLPEGVVVEGIVVVLLLLVPSELGYFFSRLIPLCLSSLFLAVVPQVVLEVVLIGEVPSPGLILLDGGIRIALHLKHGLIPVLLLRNLTILPPPVLLHSHIVFLIAPLPHYGDLYLI